MGPGSFWFVLTTFIHWVKKQMHTINEKEALSFTSKEAGLTECTQSVLRTLSISSCLMNRPLDKSRCNCAHHILWQCRKDHAFWQDNKLQPHGQTKQKHLMMANARYHSVKNLWSTRLLSTNNKIKIYIRTIFLSFMQRCDNCVSHTEETK